jgi:hypothetical protein
MWRPSGKRAKNPTAISMAEEYCRYEHSERF